MENYVGVAFSRDSGLEPSMYAFLWHLYRETGDAAYIANARCVAARARRLLMTRDGPAEEVGMQAPGYEEGRA